MKKNPTIVTRTLLYAVARYNLSINRDICYNLIERKREKMSEQREK